MKKIDHKTHRFSLALQAWYDEYKRDLPWRRTHNPYLIWLSEVILQQTRVDQGLSYYNKFVDNFPNVSLLASSDEDHVFKLWQGLGYYNRARNLHATAKYIVEQYRGVFPTAHKDVLSLKGVGDYTAAAIVSFAYNEPFATVDGNVYRVLSRVFGVSTPIDTTKGKKEFANLADELLDRNNPGKHNQAVMEFGALQCVPSSPICISCPVNDLCYAYNNNMIASLPFKQGKVSVRSRYLNYLDMRSHGFAYLKKREAKDIWQNLYEFPLVETDGECEFEALSVTDAYLNIVGFSDVIIHKKITFKHILSHQIIYATFYLLECSTFDDKSYTKVKEDDLDNYAVSRLMHKYLEKL